MGLIKNLAQDTPTPNDSVIVGRLRLFVNSEFYYKKYPDVMQAGMSPVTHYLRFGYAEGRNPNSWFRNDLVPDDLTRSHPSVPPFILFLKHLPGLSESEFNDLCHERRRADSGHNECYACSVMKKGFNAAYYREKYPDVSLQTDALSHFCEFGQREGRTPSPEFEPQYYLLNHSDLQAADVNPYVHFLTCGVNEGRKGRPSDPVKKYCLENLQSFELLAQKASFHVQQILLAQKGEIFKKIWPHYKKICVSISHDNYLVTSGGIQKFIHDESLLVQKNGIGYLQLSPTFPDFRIQGESSGSFLVQVNLNNVFLGTFSAEEVVSTLKTIKKNNNNLLEVGVIHSIMGWSIDALLDIFSVQFKEKIFYVHDYYALCTEYRLLRNNMISCGAPSLKSGECSICVHSSHREKHISQSRKIFEQLKPTVLFPSKTAEKIFLRSGILHDLKSKVIPHIIVKKTSSLLTRGVRLDEQFVSKIKLAYCGELVSHKGWGHFREICNQVLGLGQYEFHVLGSQDPGEAWIQYTPVKLTRGRSVMTEKIRDKEIDLVVVCSTWEETFNFVTYEAVQAGAAILTLGSSGNVADFVNEYCIGFVAHDWREATTILKSEKVNAKISLYKKNTEVLRFQSNKSFLTKGVLK